MEVFMAQLTGVLAVLPLLILLPCPVPACSFCPTSQTRLTFRQEIEQAKLVLYVSAANPRLSADKNAAPGSGTTDLHVLAVLKSDPVLGKRKVIPVARYIPVLDPKDPPRFVVFCDAKGDQIDAYQGRSVNSPAVLPYLDGAKDLGTDRTKALVYAFRFLDHDDPIVAEDAFLEFARSTDKEIGEAMKLLGPDKLRRLVQNPKTRAEALSLFAFLLGGCGGDRDAELLKGMIERPDERVPSALDGLLGGLINLRPRQGWDLALAVLADQKKSFPERFAVLRMLRFFHGWKGDDAKKEILRGLAVAVEDGELADLGVEDLRRWKWWDLTAKVIAQYSKETHSSPIIRRAIIRYALSCPLPEARQFLERLRRQDLEMVREVEESLKLIQE
jgi:hypothetical protein